ncbi:MULTISPECIES: hypothetical protein [Thermoactinomyces]|jgi:hypothetical protein|uniref:Uncharacterized protein n=1 Tax=Thermoactinomyces daqus TaxID=1329516 RepID=A0A7W1XAT5_9BACL|nr:MULTISPECIES: hypothetical protein [Thermoactinomyces]MBA4543184.1 hypothetical protein [Thermoactinomyces daqus]MBH8596579.1 hypothetical protein [Thermoactinomyces sp. CICC 10523]MBH8603341.1 hypothetical protein [Thermoactinomyces sp. CICC 10522]MBH8607892.1 hypothetical protein [Thermoactinomyces sp. CICC 10521]
MLIKIMVGIVLAFLIWKLLKVTLKTAFWLLILGLIVLVLSPGHLFLVEGLGLLVLGFLGGLLVLAIIGFFFFENS